MKTIFQFLMILCWTQAFGQVIPVKQVIQSKDQWCWAGVTESILDCYQHPRPQCEIAEYARTVITWHNFGTANCCINPNAGCNYWNYSWGYPGSIEDILEHFGNVSNYGVSYPLSLAESQTELTNRRLFVIRWGWYSGGGHFVVGHGVSGNTMYYMNPWPGEGLKMATYNWVKDDGVHQWTHTNKISVAVPLLPFPEPINGNDSTCLNTQVTYAVDTIAGMRFTWKVNGVAQTDTAAVFQTSFTQTGNVNVSVAAVSGNDTGNAYVFTTVVQHPAPKALVQVNTSTNELTCIQSGILYRWYRDSVLLSQQTQTITPTQNGKYAVEYEPGNRGCTSERSESYNYSNNTGLPTISRNSFRVFPNPCKGLLNIEPALYSNIELMDLSGRLIDVNANQGLVNLSDLNNGLYLLKIETKNGTVVYRVSLEKE